MTTDASTTAPPEASTRLPGWFRTLAILYLLLGIFTGLPQLYYVLYYVHLLDASPHANIIGQLWYWYGTQVDTSALNTDANTARGAIEDVFWLGPLYVATAIGILGRRAWTPIVGYLTAGGGFYGILGFTIAYLLNHAASVNDQPFFWATVIPYAALPIWLVVALITRRDLFVAKAH